MGHPTKTLDDVLKAGRRTEDGCLLWPFGTNGEGYGRVGIKGKVWVVHRFVWTALRGEIPEGMTLDHVCHNEAAAIWLCNGGDSCLHRRCFEVDHLAVKSQRDNWFDGLQGFPAQARIRTHCRNGHPYSGDNLGIDKRGARICRTCDRERAAARHQLARDARAAREPKPPRTHCANGHPWLPENLEPRGNSFQCVICRREYHRLYMEKQRRSHGIPLRPHGNPLR